MAGITHAKTSAKSDGSDSSLVLPSDWNADHTVGNIGGTPAVVLSSTAAAGNATTYLRTNDQIIAFDATAPTTQAFSDAAAAGSAAVAARRDHKHAWPALGTTAAAVGTSAGGSATTPSKSDHVHATGAGTPSTQAFGDAAATGTGPAASMTDHKHAMPADPFLAGRKLLATFSKQGVVAVTTEADTPPPMRIYNDSGRTLTFHTIRATATTGPAGSAMTIDANVDGTTIMTGTKVVIADGGNTVAQTTFSTTTIADGHYVSINVDAVGSGTAGSNLTVAIWCTG
jgi:hypothetical protein